MHEKQKPSLLLCNVFCFDYLPHELEELASSVMGHGAQLSQFIHDVDSLSALHHFLSSLHNIISILCGCRSMTKSAVCSAQKL